MRGSRPRAFRPDLLGARELGCGARPVPLQPARELCGVTATHLELL
jgi:hypothetical protein